MVVNELAVGEQCRISIQFDAAQRTKPLAAVRIDANRLRVIEQDPLWEHAEVNMNDAGLRIQRGVQ